MTDTLFAARAGSLGTSDLYTVDPATAVLTSVGAIGFAVTGLAFHPGTGVLYGMTSNNSTSNPRSLISIDPVTGAGTLIGSTGLASGFAIGDIAFHSNGVLYGYGGNADHLYTINLANGTVTDLGVTGIGTFGSGGMSFDSADLLWVAITKVSGGSPHSHLWTIDVSMGPTATQDAAISYPAVAKAFPAAAMDASDNFWAWQFDVGTTCELLWQATSGGSTTHIADANLDQTDALAWQMATVGPATKLAFGVEPSEACAGATITPAITVRVEDAGGNLVGSATNAVTIAIGTNPGGGTLSGTLTVNAVSGIATFNDLSINNGASGYVLHATASGLTAADSSAFDIVALPANDTCASATAIGGVSGSTSGNTRCAAKETPDALDTYYSTTVEHTVFYKYTAPADGYIEFTIDKPGGSVLNKMTAGVLTGSCGAQSVYVDDLLFQEAVTDVSSFPVTIGHQVTAGQTVYLEIADDTGSGGHSPGAYSLAWSLRTLTNYDCIQDVERFGPPALLTPDLAAVNGIGYVRDPDGNHWIGYSLLTSGPTEVFYAAMLDAAGTGWTYWTVHNVPGSGSDQFLSFRNFVMATDGTHVWFAASRRDDDDGRTIQISIYEYGGGAWPLLGEVTCSHGNVDGVQPFVRLAADPLEPGVVYVAVSDTGDSPTAPNTYLAKFDDTTLLWETNPFATRAGAGNTAYDVVNGTGSPLLFYNADGTDVVTMYAINPTTGALTSLQNFTSASPSGSNASGGSPVVTSMTAVSRRPFLNPITGQDVYYLGVYWTGHVIANAIQWYMVKSDGSTDFTFFDNDVTRSLVGIHAGAVVNAQAMPETRNVWWVSGPSIPGSAVASFDRVCDNAWQFSGGAFLASNLGLKFQDLDGDLIYNLGVWPEGESLVDTDLAVVVGTISRSGCFCQLGPEVDPPVPGQGIIIAFPNDTYQMGQEWTRVDDPEV